MYRAKRAMCVASLWQRLVAQMPADGEWVEHRGPSASLWGWKLVTLGWGLCAITNTVPLFIPNLARLRDIQITRISKIKTHIFIQMKTRISKG